MTTAKAAVAVFLLLLLLTTGGAENVGEEKKMCKYKSKKFWGVCLSDSRCTDVCRREGFQHGDCSTIRRQCTCLNRC